MGKKSANPEEKVFAGGLIGGESAFAGQDEIGPGRDVRRRTGRWSGGLCVRCSCFGDTGIPYV